MAGQDFFSWDNLQNIANINAHIEYAQELMRKYNNDENFNRGLESQLQRIINKQNDKLLNLSVIGEFSTGKSSFINALIRDDLLVSSSLQGTTITNTVIDYCPSYAICLHYLNGKKAAKEYEDLESLKKDLSILTTDPKLGKTLKCVRVGLPSKNLNIGFRIIDTPGTNATERWHEEVTKDAIHNLSDLSIILIDALHPLPETLLSFIDNSLNNVLSQCAFVVTKIDVLPENERAMMMQYVRKKLQDFLGIENILVLPYVSPMVINTFKPGMFNIKDDAALLQESIANEKRILDHMHSQKIKAQTQKLIVLIRDMFDNISAEIDDIKSNYNNELALLNKSRQIDLRPFITEQKSDAKLLFKDMTDSKISSFSDMLYKRKNSVKNKLKAPVRHAASIDIMKNYVQNELRDLCIKEAEKFVAEGNRFYGTQKKCYSETMQVFQNNFEKYFKDLRILKMSMKNMSIKSPDPRDISISNIDDISNYITEELSNENWAFGGGAATGAILGSAICPGAGTIVGLIAGIFAGSKIAPDTEKVKEKLLGKLNIALNSYFNSIINSIESSVNDFSTRINNKIDGEIEKYRTSYENIVIERIKEQRSNKYAIEDRIKNITNDQKELENRSIKLEEISLLISKQQEEQL